MKNPVTRAYQIRLASEEQRSVDVIASTDAQDSYGDIVEQVWDLERYGANPVVLFAHNSRELPIGKASDIGVVDGQLRAKLHFVDAKANPLAEQVWQSIKQGSLRAVSVGFYPKDVRWEKRDGREVMVLSNNELLEISVTPVPANPDALAQLHARAAPQRKIEQKDDYMKEFLKMLGLAEGASEGEIRAALDKMTAFEREVVALSGRATAPEALAVLRAWQTAHGQVETLSGRVAELESKLATGERTRLLEVARRSARITPAMEADVKWQKMVASFSPDMLGTYLETLPVQLPTERLKQSDSEEDGVTLTAEELSIAKQMGNDPAKVLETKRAHIAARKGA
jgi:HK97 family phage prohead protease